MRNWPLVALLPFLLLLTVSGSLAKVSKPAAPLLAPPPLRPVDPKSADFERHIVIPPDKR
jgi:hypothetical protein